MSDFVLELEKLLKPYRSDFIKQLKLIASLSDFRPLKEESNIYTVEVVIESKGVYKLYDIKTIHGKASISSRLKESVRQSNRVLLNLRCSYDSRLLAQELKTYFKMPPEAMEVLIIKVEKLLLVTRRFALHPKFRQQFRSVYER